jgi:putative drug exporter of the RND superfamily
MSGTGGAIPCLSGPSASVQYAPRVRIHAAFGGIGSFAVKFRWLIVLVWVVAAIGVPRALPSLSSVTQGNNANFLPASAPSEHALQLAKPLGGSTLLPVPVVAAAQGTLTPAEQAWLQKLQRDLAKVNTVVKVRDLGRSPDGQAAQLQVLSNVSQGGAGNEMTTLVNDLRAAIARDGPPSGLSVHLAGAVAINADQQAKSGNTDSQIQLLSIIFIVALLLLVFRALLAPFVTLIPAFFAVTISGPLVAEAGQHGLKVSPLAQILLIVLVLGAGTDYGLFLVFRVRENLRAGLDKRLAVIAAVERVGESITFSAATVIAALLSLLAATFAFYSDLGIPLAIGIGVMLLAGLTLLPALLAIFGRAVFWPSKTQAGTGKTGVWGRVSVRIVRHPVPTLVAGLVVFGGLAVAASANTPAGFGGQTNAPSGSDSAAGAAILSAHFPNTSANPTNIIYELKQPAWNDLQALQTARSQLAASGLFTAVTGPLNPNGATLTPAQLTALHDRLGPPQLLPPTPPAGTSIPPTGYQLYRATALYISPDGRTVQFQTGLKAGDPSTTAAMNAIPAVRTEAATVMRSIGAADYGVGGQAPAIYDISSISNSDLATVIPIAIVVIGFLLALVMRSLVAPLYLILSVGLSYLAALGLSVLVFIEIAGDGGLVFFLPFLMFIFLLALGEDYNILVMSRIREEAQRLPLKEAVSRALVATGTTVTSAGLVLGGTFSVFAIVGAQQGSTQFRDVGAGLALGVLMDTFLVRTLLVPSTVVLLGRWNWWPSKMSRPGAGLPGVTGDEEPGAPVSAQVGR